MQRDEVGWGWGIVPLDLCMLCVCVGGRTGSPSMLASVSDTTCLVLSYP